MTMAKFFKRVAVALALPIVLLVAWWLATSLDDSFFWPPPTKIAATFAPTWFEGRIIADVIPSVLRLLAGYTLALVIGVSLGVVIGSYRVVRAILEPALEFFRAIPPPVLVPILILFAGIGDVMKIIVILIGCVWPILLNTVEGVRAVDGVLRDTATSYQLGGRTRLVHLVLRGASPQIMTGARQSLSIGIILMVISEMFAASNGIGYALVRFQREFAIPQMWTGIVLLGLIGVLLSLVFRLVESRVLSWYSGQRQMERGA